MANVNMSNLFEPTFTRDTKVDYKNGNAIINSVFKKYDKDLSGDFNDEEWATYQKDMESHDKYNIIVQHYEVKLKAVREKSDEISKQWAQLDSSTWDKLLEFEQKHPTIGRFGIKDNESIPDGALEYDISPFEMGIYDEKQKRFTGECYKKGYIAGLETLSEEDKSNYLDLLDKTSEVSKKAIELRIKSEKIQNEYFRYLGLKDMAQCGEIEYLPNKDEENAFYNKYIQIRDESNPFYKEMKELEKEQEELHLKGSWTDDDYNRFAEINTRLSQLRDASMRWSIADIDCNKPIKRNRQSENTLGNTISKEKSFNTQIGNFCLGNVVTCTSTSISNTTSGRFNISQNNPKNNSFLRINGYGAFTQTFNNAKNFDISGRTNVNLNYTKGNFGIGAGTNTYSTKEMQRYEQNAAIEYKGLKAFVNEDIVHTANEAISGTTYTTKVGVAHRWKCLSNSASVTLANEGNTYNVETGINLHKQDKNGMVGMEISVPLSYQEVGNVYTLSPRVNFNGAYEKDDVTLSITANENLTAIMTKNEAQISNNLSVIGNLKYENLQTALKFNNFETNGARTNTYGLELGYTFENLTLNLSSNLQTSKTSCTEDVQYTPSVSLGCKFKF